MKKFALVIITIFIFLSSTNLIKAEEPAEMPVEESSTETTAVFELQIIADGVSKNYTESNSFEVKESLTLEGKTEPNSKLEFRITPDPILIETMSDVEGKFKILVPIEEIKKGTYTGELSTEWGTSEKKNELFVFEFTYKTNVVDLLPETPSDTTYSDSIKNYLNGKWHIVATSIGITAFILALIVLASYLIKNKKHPKISVDKSVNEKIDVIEINKVAGLDDKNAEPDPKPEKSSKD